MNAYTFLIGMYISEVTMQISMAYPQNIKNRSAKQYSSTTVGYVTRRHKLPYDGDICKPIFMVTLLTIEGTHQWLNA
jgi:hypothetical protein